MALASRRLHFSQDCWVTIQVFVTECGENCKSENAFGSKAAEPVLDSEFLLCHRGYYIGSLIEIPAKLGIISWTSII